jgi:hypothetical protein
VAGARYRWTNRLDFHQPGDCQRPIGPGSGRLGAEHDAIGDVLGGNCDADGYPNPNRYTCAHGHGHATGDLPARHRPGCPSGGLSSTDFAHQEFEHGQMLYRHDLRTVYVLYMDGTWSAFHDNYVEGEPFQLQQLSPPNGLKQPIKGFDRVWEQPAVRARLGWGMRDEASVIQGQAQAFERGQAMWVNRPGYLTAYFVLFADGTWAEYR